MDFYLTASNGTRLLFPLNPAKVDMTTAARMETHATIELGEIALPRGNLPDKISWEGILPGEARRALSFVREWRDPKEIEIQLRRWKEIGEKLRLMITETNINMDVYIEAFDASWGGGFGDVLYTINFIQARNMIITTAGGTSSTYSVQSAVAATRSTNPPPKTYVVKPSDSLWLIAKSLLQNGERWKDIYNEPTNRKLIGPDPNKIYPGQTLVIPA